MRARLHDRTGRRDRRDHRPGNVDAGAQPVPRHADGDARTRRRAATRSATGRVAANRVTSVPLNARADAAATASLREIAGRAVAWFRIAGGKHHGAIGLNGAAAVERAVQLAGELSIPLVGELDTSGADLREGVSALHAWGRLARALAGVSGRVPTVAIVTG